MSILYHANKELIMKLLKLFITTLVVAATFMACDPEGPFTLYFEIAEKDGNGVSFYAYELETYNQAENILNGYNGYYNKKIEQGTADEVAEVFLFSALYGYVPICGKILTEENKDYDNKYNFKGQVLLKAHDDGKAYGYWQKGKCRKDCPAIMPPNADLCPNGNFEPRYDEDEVCVVGFECIQHKPVCKYVGDINEGWYWQDTDEKIKDEKCEGRIPECINIGTRSEGWNIFIGPHILWDFCAEEVGISRD
jgi:hypothetical protein